ncbi:MAG: YicC family protein [Alistipes sp.]|nr:YicC family protein [Alistipes sp.]MBQ1978497.1 YicC family protein [Alistipes sp.]MBQ5620042.1 YicC family protein [Alistipes sp.]
MTGFGKGEVVFQTKKITVEIRTLNSKQLDLNLRMPAAYRGSEYDVRSILSRRIQRGKTDVFIAVESQQVATPAHINNELFREYLRQLTTALASANLEVSYETILPIVMRMPEVVSSEQQAISEEEQQALLKAVEEACDKLDTFREQEGAILISDLLKRIDLIEQYKEEVVPFEVQRAATIKNRIQEHLNQLQVEVDQSRLEQEMIYYIEKLDITEEKVRLKNHCKYFREVAAGEEGIGRKLGFIAQELGREINTMGSKANETNIQILVVKMKDELEKIKEQVLNIL